MALRGKCRKSDTMTQDFYTQQWAEAPGPEPPRPSQQKQRRRRLKRIAIASGASLVVLGGVVVGGGFLAVNHLANGVHRIHVVALDTKTQAAWSGGMRGSMTILLTDTGVFPDNNADAGLVELVDHTAHTDRSHGGT